MGIVINRTTKQIIQSAHVPNYAPDDWVRYARPLGDEIKIIILKDLIDSQVPAKYLTFDNTDTASAMQQSDKDVVDAAIAQAIADAQAAAQAAEDAKLADPATADALAAKPVSAWTPEDAAIAFKLGLIADGKLAAPAVPVKP